MLAGFEGATPACDGMVAVTVDNPEAVPMIGMLRGFTPTPVAVFTWTE